jgi:septal ring factor EnvC (AmiA/AmiB activator)
MAGVANQAMRSLRAERRRGQLAVAVLCSALVLANTPARAQYAHPASEQAAKEFRDGQDRLARTERRTRVLEADVAQMGDERANLTVQLQETARLIQKSEAQLNTIEGRRDALEAQQKQLQGSLNQRQGSIATLLGAMQRMGRNPPPAIITRREDALEMVRSAMLLARAFPELRSEAAELTGRLGELVQVMTQIRAERDKVETESQRLKEAQERLASLMETKRQSMAERQQELEQMRQEATEISKKVTDLSELISSLDKTVAELTGLGSYEKEIRADAAPAPAPPAADTEKPPEAAAQTKGTQVAVALPPRPPSPAVELTPKGGALSGSPGRMKPAIPFHLAKAQLPKPAQGRRVLSFGETTSNGRRSQGLVVETRQGAQITSPCDGWIVYAGEFRSYGQLLIINAGGGYHVLLAGLSHIDVQLGQFVLAAEPVGTMSAAPKGKAQDNAPVLYVEFRKEGRPIDPDPWWSVGQQKVQG